MNHNKTKAAPPPARPCPPSPKTDLVVDVALEGELEGAFPLGERLGKREGGRGQLEVEGDGRCPHGLSLLSRRSPLGPFGGRDERGLHDVDLLAVEGHAAGFLQDLPCVCVCGWVLM